MGTILGMARLAVLAGALALTGCVTTENSLSTNDIAAMKLTGVTVSYAPDALVQWDDGIRAYAASKGIVDDIGHPRPIRRKARPTSGTCWRRESRPEWSRQMAGQLNGTRPVRLELVVQSFTIASAVQRILIGGGHDMSADANLVDARTGAVIIAHPKLVAVMAGGEGVIGTAVQASDRPTAARPRSTASPLSMEKPSIATGCCARPVG